MKSTLHRVRDLYDDRARFGAYSTLAPHNQGGRKSRYVAEVFAEALRSLLATDGPSIRLLDFGCGTGLTLDLLSTDTELALGVDLSPRMLSVARDLLDRNDKPFQLLQTDGLNLPFADASFNRIIAREVLCHVPDEHLPTVLAELARITTTGGLFYLIDQVSESLRWQHNTMTPLVRKRAVGEWIDAFATANFSLRRAEVVRQPRFPWIYAVWAGLVPQAAIAPLAHAEVRWNRHFGRLATSRWQVALFVFERLKGNGG